MKGQFHNFPELMHDYRCKLCQLAETKPGLLRIVHRMRLKEGHGAKALHRRLQHLFERHGVELPSERAIGRHFEKHVDMAFLVEAQPVVAPKFDIPDMELGAFEDLATGENDSDYHHMADLFKRVVRRIAALDADPTAFLIEGTNKHAFQKLGIWSGMINNARQILESLNKMRNSDRMTVSILEQHTRKFALTLSAPMAQVLREIREDLTTVPDEKADYAVKRIEELLSERMPQIMTEAAAQAMRESKEQYKLLN